MFHCRQTVNSEHETSLSLEDIGERSGIQRFNCMFFRAVSNVADSGGLKDGGENN